MSQHTPGEWQLIRDDDREEYDVCVPAKVGIRGIATISFGYSEPAESEQHANAKLIAAAPELLGALERLWAASVGCSDEEISARLHARATIAKATE